MSVAVVACCVLTGCRGESRDSSAAVAVPPTSERAESPPENAERPVVDPSTEVHGKLTSRDGQRVLELWGTPAEMGYAHGYLLREPIIDVVDHYALDVIPPATLDAAGGLYATVADISEARRAEAAAIVDGMKAAGGAHISELDRDLRATDLLVLNAMTDLLAIGCSSVSAWGDSTQADGELAGDPIVVRNLDWSDTPALLRNQLLISYAPSDPKSQPLVSVAFAGYIGCLSCMNEAGVTALFNMGYGDGAASLTAAAGGFAPSNLAIRDAMERRDIDEDGLTTANDVEHWLRQKTHAGSYIVHLLEPRRADQTSPARVLEVEADGIATRWPKEDDDVGASSLVATNHLREKTAPTSCRRYARVERALERSKHAVDAQSLWAIGRSVRLPAVVHMLSVEPGRKRMRVWLRQPSEAADSSAAPVTHEWVQLFARGAEL